MSSYSKQKQIMHIDSIVNTSLAPSRHNMALRSHNDDMSPLRAALALNNIAVNLMWQQSYQAAAKVMRDSLQAMEYEKQNRRSKVSQSSLSSLQSIECTCVMKDSIQNATEMNAEALSASATSTAPAYSQERRRRTSAEDDDSSEPTDPTRRRRRTIQLQVVDDQDFSALQMAAKEGRRYGNTFAVRIASSDNNKNQEEMSRFTGIILYNHGLANLLLSTQEQSRQRRQRCLSTAAASLQTCDRVFYSLSKQNADNEDDSEDDDKTYFVSFLRIMSVNCLYHALSHQGLIHQASQVYDLAWNLCEQLLEQDSFVAIMVDLEATAAAAAA